MSVLSGLCVLAEPKKGHPGNAEQKSENALILLRH
jgi:hypothetical protein